jgi:hypothetical protein
MFVVCLKGYFSSRRIEIQGLVFAAAAWREQVFGNEEAGLKSRSDHLEDIVAGLVSVFVIHRSKAVEVEQKSRRSPVIEPVTARRQSRGAAVKKS